MSVKRTAKMMMIRNITRTAVVVILGLLLTECSPSSEEESPRPQIVLSGSRGVFLADWRGYNLRPKLLTDFSGVVEIIAGSASVANHIIGIVGSPSDTRTDTPKRAVYLIDPSTGRYEKVFEGPVNAIAIAPDKKSIALLSKDVLLYDLTEHRARPVVRGRALLTLTLSWKPDGEHLTYDTRDGWIESANLRTQRTEHLVKGLTPAWSPDGTKLAYQQRDAQGETVLLYDPARGTSQELYRRSAWQREIYAYLYWSPDGRYLSFNVSWNLLGLTSDRCVVLEVASGKTFTVRSGGLYCGPWLTKQ